MANLPTGTVTFLFTDIEGSTKRWERETAAMSRAVARHDHLLRTAIAQHHGYVFKTVGDAFCAAFPSALDGLQATLEAQRALHAEPWPEAVDTIKVRMALHTGEAEERDADYFGPPVNRVARLLSTVAGGQIVLSGASREELGEPFPLTLGEVTLRDLGQHRLKDLTQPERIFQVVAPDLPAEFPPLKSLDSRPHNLPAQPNPLLGREGDVAVIVERLQHPEVRLLTLTGPGGIGKTRLALQVAADSLDAFLDGTYLVSLASVSDPALVETSIATALGVREARGQSLYDTLLGYLADKHLLLVLDNFEHLLDAAPVVASLLAGCRKLKVVATSRATLHLQGEQEYPVPPLALPERGRTLPSVELEQYPAVTLFAARAQALQPSFRLTPENGPIVAEICHRLDGLPLAIELAAARIKLLGPHALLQRLSSRLKLLTGGARDLPERQRTLRSTIAWSYDLLDPAEQQLFRRLCIFTGGCCFEAIEVVCNAESDLELDVLDGLASLMDKSLVRQAAPEDEERRFMLLETIREYGLERLADSGEMRLLSQRHAQYFLPFAETREARLDGPEALAALDQLTDDHDNLRAALRYAIGQRDSPVALRFGVALFRFWWIRGFYTEGRRWLDEILALPTIGESSVQSRGLCLVSAGHLAGAQSTYDRAEHLFAEARELADQGGDRRVLAQALLGLGIVAQDRGEHDRAEERLRAALAHAEAASHAQTLGSVLIRLGLLATDQGDLLQADTYYLRALQLDQKTGNRRGSMPVLNNLGISARLRGDYDAAQAYFTQTLHLAREFEAKGGVAVSLFNLGVVARKQGAQPRAAEAFGEALTYHHELGNVRGIETTIRHIGGVAIEVGNAWHGTCLLGASEALREVLGTPLTPDGRATYDADLPAAQAALASGDFMAAWHHGRSLQLEDAIAEAQRVVTDVSQSATAFHG